MVAMPGPFLLHIEQRRRWEGERDSHLETRTLHRGLAHRQGPQQSECVFPGKRRPSRAPGGEGRRDRLEERSVATAYIPEGPACPSIHPSIHLLVCLSICPCIHPSIHLYFLSFIHLSIHRFTHPAISPCTP